MILVHSSPTSLVRDHGHPPNLGVMSSPDRFYPEAHEAGYRWCADNGAFSNWDEKAFLKMLDAIDHVPGCLFVVAPDVVGFADWTLELFHRWKYRIWETGQPIAYVIQNGSEDVEPPWDEIDALFIGGTDYFKLGPVAARLARRARFLGKHLHMGRVNSRLRIRYAKSLGCHSIDGTNFSMYRRTNLPWALTWAASEQLWSAA